MALARHLIELQDGRISAEKVILEQRARRDSHATSRNHRQNHAFGDLCLHVHAQITTRWSRA
eukprot:6193950-Pleurochrysis_carterae.AAC.1